jgi:hypothetical protein
VSDEQSGDIGNGDGERPEPMVDPRRTVPVAPVAGRTHDRSVADAILDGITGAATAAHHFATDHVQGGLSLRDTVDSLRELAAADHDAAVDDVEKMLRAQAATLGVMFSELTKRAARHLDGPMAMLEGYVRLALRAQEQARRTAETLATLKNPAGVVIAKNINNGQQVNIGALHQATLQHHEDDHARQIKVPAVERVDTGTASAPVGGNPRLEAVGTVNRATDP